MRHKGTKAQRQPERGLTYIAGSDPDRGQSKQGSDPILWLLLISYCLLLLSGCGGSSNPPANGALMISAQNSSGGSVSATILLNNGEKGNAPLQISDLTPGTYTLLLQSAGYTDYTSSVVVQSGQTTTVTATMETVSVPEGPVFTKTQ